MNEPMQTKQLLSFILLAISVNNLVNSYQLINSNNETLKMIGLMYFSYAYNTLEFIKKIN